MLQKFRNWWQLLVVKHWCVPYDEDRELYLQNQRKADKINSDINSIKDEIDNANYHDQFFLINLDIERFKVVHSDVENLETIISDLEEYLSYRIEFVQKVWVIE